MTQYRQLHNIFNYAKNTDKRKGAYDSIATEIFHIEQDSRMPRIVPPQMRQMIADAAVDKTVPKNKTKEMLTFLMGGFTNQDVTFTKTGQTKSH